MTDDVTHLRALLAEQTARAERAEADYRRVLSERAEANQLAGRCAQQRDQALAACAELRAALEAQDEYSRGAPAIVSNDAEYWRRVKTQEQRRATATRMREAALSRPDLGVGKVLVAGPLDALVDNLVRVVCDCHDGSDLWAHTRRDPEAFRRAVRSALLKKGGG